MRGCHTGGSRHTHKNHIHAQRVKLGHNRAETGTHPLHLLVWKPWECPGRSCLRATDPQARSCLEWSCLCAINQCGSALGGAVCKESMHERTPMHGYDFGACHPCRWLKVKSDPCHAWKTCTSSGMSVETITVWQCTKSKLYGSLLALLPSFLTLCALKLACAGLPYRQKLTFQAHPGLLNAARSLIKLAQACANKSSGPP